MFLQSNTQILETSYFGVGTYITGGSWAKGDLLFITEFVVATTNRIASTVNFDKDKFFFIS